MIMAFLTAHFARWGVPQRFREPLAWITLILAAIALLASMKALYDASVIDDHETERAVRSIDARDKAAEDRAADTIANSQAERERNDAIAKASDGPPSDADRMLNCQRLRHLGRIPPGC
jgi:hypothetical protein